MSRKPNQTPRRETPLRFMGFEFPSATALRDSAQRDSGTA